MATSQVQENDCLNRWHIFPARKLVRDIEGEIEYENIRPQKGGLLLPSGDQKWRPKKSSSSGMGATLKWKMQDMDEAMN